MKELTLPLSDEAIASLHAGDTCYLSGILYTARDCAHRRLFDLIDRGMPLPLPLQEATIYYAGPCPAPEGKACGSCGPTTSARMNAFAPRLFDLGLRGIIGKGEMNGAVIDAIRRNKKVYFAAIGGAGAFYGNAIKECECVAFPDLMSEAIFRLRVEHFPVVVAIDSSGKSIYQK